MDRIDQQIVAALLTDGRMTYQELGRQVRLSANSVADRVRRLQASGVICGFQAKLGLRALGRNMEMISDIRLRDGVDREAFEAGLQEVPQIVAAMRLTGEYDYQLRMACCDSREFETVIDHLKADLGVQRLHSRLMLHEVPLKGDRLVRS
ncbi:Lrp/AsnC family transcriptional regulator [Streptomyces abyssomicinicus]|uniref:Lrp/AsnC family transcriptional regulator n=1 Tax=Streptomyces abyssomicinicus TaxID=574929 RepID=UPI00124FE505|nr:Lrp/AsnC family transcriptional regulator [Streptomyces abyssomicinicus]